MSQDTHATELTAAPSAARLRLPVDIERRARFHVEPNFEHIHGNFRTQPECRGRVYRHCHFSQVQHRESYDLLIFNPLLQCVLSCKHPISLPPMSLRRQTYPFQVPEVVGRGRPQDIATNRSLCTYANLRLSDEPR